VFAYTESSNSVFGPSKGDPMAAGVCGWREAVRGAR
jgi:hypothetical protein